MNILQCDSDQTKQWRAAHAAVVIVTVASMLTIIGWRLLHQMSFWQWNAVFIGCVALLVVLRLNRTLPGWASNSIYVLSFASAIAANVWANHRLALYGSPFSPFDGFKLVSVTASIVLTTPLWIGRALIISCGIAPLVLYYGFIPESLRSAFSAQEPFLSTIYAAIAYLILRYHVRAINLERSIERVKSDRRTVTDLARIFFGLRDLTNTPLQSIELTCQLLKAEKLPPKVCSEYLEKSLIRLRELSAILATYEKEVDWTMTESSLDPAPWLTEKLAEIIHRSKSSGSKTYQR